MFDGITGKAALLPLTLLLVVSVAADPACPGRAQDPAVPAYEQASNETDQDSRFYSPQRRQGRRGAPALWTGSATGPDRLSSFRTVEGIQAFSRRTTRAAYPLHGYRTPPPFG